MPQTQTELEAEIAILDTMLAETEATLRDLVARENPAKGVFFAHEIHTLRQQKLVLKTRQELRRTHIRRILAGMA